MHEVGCIALVARDLCPGHLRTVANDQVGVMLAAKDYDFGVKEVFQMSDILDLQAVVKHSTPVCTDARDLLESGKLRLAQVKTLARMTYFVSFAWPCCVLCASELSRSISARLWCLVVSWRLTMRTV